MNVNLAFLDYKDNITLPISAIESRVYESKSQRFAITIHGMENWFERVLAHLENTGMKQKELAARLGVQPNKLNHWLKGKHFPRDPRIQELIAHELGLEMTELFGESADRKVVITDEKEAAMIDTYRHLTPEARSVFDAMLKTMLDRGVVTASGNVSASVVGSRLVNKKGSTQSETQPSATTGRSDEQD